MRERADGQEKPSDFYRWERRKRFFFCICKVAREMEINQTPIGIRGGGRSRCRWGVPGRSERKSSKSNIKIDLRRAISSRKENRTEKTPNKSPVSQKLQNDDGELMEMQIEMAMWMRPEEVNDNRWEDLCEISLYREEIHFNLRLYCIPKLYPQLIN